jgi:hypothetical protein
LLAWPCGVLIPARVVYMRDLSFVIALLEALIWEWQIFTMNDVLFSLCAGDVDAVREDICLGLIEELLHGSGFMRRYEHFLALGYNPNFEVDEWEWTDRLVKFQTEFPEYFHFEKLAVKRSDVKPVEPLPLYYDHPVIRTIPCFELLIHRLIEYDQTHLLVKVITNFKSLLAYHPFIHRFVRRVLTYFYEQESFTPAARLKLLSLVTLRTRAALEEFLRGSPDGNEVVGAMKDRFTLKYVQVQFCALSIALEAESEGDHRFVEYRSFQEQLLSEFVMGASASFIVLTFPKSFYGIELLVLPYSAAELSRLLLNCVLYPSLAQPHEGSMAGRINALTHIYRLTPEGFRTELFVTMAQLLGANFDAPLQDYAFSKTLGFDMSASHITLVVAQSLLAHAQVTWQTDIPRFLEFLQRCKSPKEDRSLITTFEQVLYICHMVGPFLESMDDFALKNEAKERPILEQVFLALLELILQVSINYAEDSNLIPAEDAVVDFL